MKILPFINSILHYFTYFVKIVKYFIRGDKFMSYVDPSIKDKFETLSKELQEAILERDVKLYSMKDLIKVLEEIVAEGE